MKDMVERFHCRLLGWRGQDRSLEALPGDLPYARSFLTFTTVLNSAEAAADAFRIYE